jgi:hypothetical protein
LFTTVSLLYHLTPQYLLAYFLFSYPRNGNVSKLSGETNLFSVEDCSTCAAANEGVGYLLQANTITKVITPL